MPNQPYWGGRRSERIRKALRATGSPCCICGQPIDYTIPYPEPDSFTVEHHAPQSLAPQLALDPTNCGAAHLRCNQSRGNRPAPPSLGDTSTQW